jgi:hypothetical protein
MTITFTKLSILALYSRIFGRTGLQWKINSCAVVTALWGVAACVTGTLGCIPTRKFWEPQVHGQCMDVFAFYCILQVPNLILDLIIVALPMQQMATLQMNRRQRLRIISIFSCAILYDHPVYGVHHAFELTEMTVLSLLIVLALAS